ncbi:MAG: hypothetical protein KatS3mg087_0329 [Patescibacteria group bacterium]|jgi:F-type H+-transporting ATPase subunit epsilon|nr:MAG: hypothetical protein KatS3mg087_0329 [Patescibacteria group bacterium]
MRLPIDNTDELVKVVVRTPEKLLYEGECLAVSAQNSVGPFDVLAGHQNFITNINGMVTLQMMDEKQNLEYFVQVGVLRVNLNTVSLFIILLSE